MTEDTIVLIFPKKSITDLGDGFVMADTQMTKDKLLLALLKYESSNTEMMAVKKICADNPDEK